VVSFVTIMAPQITVDVPSSVCPVLATARIVAGKWTLLMLRDLADGPRRFSELQRSLAGISPRTLSVRLRALEEEGILERREFAEMPPRVEYRLTEKGSHLVPIVEAMREYGSRWLGAAEDCDEVLLEAVAS
jgi:DNA-binding HxlR family transcriptional regulator